MVEPVAQTPVAAPQQNQLTEAQIEQLTARKYQQLQ